MPAMPKALQFFYGSFLENPERTELESWLRWNDPNGIWDPSDPEYTELPIPELVSIIRRMISGE